MCFFSLLTCVLSQRMDSTGYCDISQLLTQFPDLDKLLNGLVVVSTHTHTGGGGSSSSSQQQLSQAAKRGIDTLIYLKQTLLLTPRVGGVLQGGIIDQCGSGSGSGSSGTSADRDRQQGQGQGQLSSALFEALRINLSAPSLDALSVYTYMSCVYGCV